MEHPNSPINTDWLQEAEAVLIRYCGEFSPFLIASAEGAKDQLI